MSKCENCIHYEVCSHQSRMWEDEGYRTDFNTRDDAEKICEQFKDKSLFVEIVRCKDCKYWKCLSLDPIIANLWGECYRPIGDYSCCETSENDFCSYAERKLQEAGE